MSSYIKQLKNPLTKKKQKALCIDDYFGQHEYGYFFLKNGKDATWDHFYNADIGKDIWLKQFDIFNEYNLK
jgi:hypothetical protein